MDDMICRQCAHCHGDYFLLFCLFLLRVNVACSLNYRPNRIFIYDYCTKNLCRVEKSDVISVICKVQYQIDQN